MITTRPATPADAAAIAAIYNQGITDRIATFETQPRSEADILGWFQGRHPVVVAEVNGATRAFANSSTYRPRACYDGVAEFSVYVERSYRGKGAGRAAILALIDAVAPVGIWKLVSRVFVENIASRTMLRSVGFREVGVYENHAKLDEVWRDVVIVERLIEANIT
ncbi:GNAT family N-acetyltransferase [Oscillochloris sp. ZM17-4]|uniref:arsinothricin resistance N-acetyltransferase ArsN1 family A n=1 Tax=Oscillochloris sp. ZM17-4 TaxID=2866714 RepID=UPI001C7325C0|nr:arsinothricin resistance N-acetyltransferase ArsN1 family A [Oscillochloris sp. ZM17-4]MBX0329931.1 GNAT family N-acetyltransferase [Oscillochloris sp. ZM17-4]